LGISPKAKFFRTILVNPVFGAAVKATSDIVYRNKCEYNMIGDFILIGHDIPGKDHAGIDPIWLTRMNAIIDQYDPFIVLADIFRIGITIIADKNQVKRKPCIGHTHCLHFYFAGCGVKLLPPADDFVVGGGLGCG
jgi:hypothetical protein